jgi:hypothetical protein
VHGLCNNSNSRYRMDSAVVAADSDDGTIPSGIVEALMSECCTTRPCLEEECTRCWGDNVLPGTVITDPPKRCGLKFDEKSVLICVEAEGHTGGHSYRYPDTVEKVPVRTDHTYYVSNNGGLFKCCKLYLRELLLKASTEKWPRYTNGFRTKCTKCNGWMKLKGDTFHFDTAWDKK